MPNSEQNLAFNCFSFNQIELDRKFITTEPLGKRGEAGEQKVWDNIRVTFASRECFGYWRYPIFSKVGETRKEPDILMVDFELGIIVIEVKSIAIDQIIGISGHRWELQDYYTTASNPYQQAEHQLLTLLEYCDREPSLSKKISGRALIALPFITEAEWQEKGFNQLPSNPPILFKDSLELSTFNPQSILSIIAQSSVIKGQAITPQQWKLLQAVIGGTQLFHPNKSNRWRIYPAQSRADILVRAREALSEFDLQQERISKTIPPGAQRIRGIAGSGKTVLLCQKAAHMHLKHPDWQIALVFFSRSLYRTILEQIDRWLRHFSNNEIHYHPQNLHLRVLHAWGAKTQPGLYSTLCRQAGVRRLTASDTESKQPHEALAEVCIHLLRETAIPQIFDAILIDEGQDFIVNDALKYQNKQPFYWMAYQALRPAEATHPEQRRLIWAYDEAQSLDSLKIPTASEIFGEELGHLVTGQYPGGIPKSEIMAKCYRTPGPILTAAHGIGMGLLRPGGMLTGITRTADWQAIGYEVTGRFIPGQMITLKRPLENSPNLIPQLWQSPVLEFKAYRSRQEELTALARNIFSNLRQEGLKPSRDILVIVLGKSFEAMELETYVASFLMEQGIDIYIPGTLECNILKPERDRRNPNQFWCEGGVTVTRVPKAKGNEADMVYILGLDRVAKQESNLLLRNQLFVALTRARAWVSLSGIGYYDLYEEMWQVMQSGNTFTFTFRHPPQREIGVTDASELLKRYAAGGRNFQNADLRKAQLKGANLQGANLVGALLMKADLSHANLDGAKLAIADLTQANLTGASLRKTNLIRATLTAAKLAGADLYRADLSDSQLVNANLQGANLNAANLSGADLRETNLDAADLNQANLTEAILPDGCDFS